MIVPYDALRRKIALFAVLSAAAILPPPAAATPFTFQRAAGEKVVARRENGGDAAAAAQPTTAAAMVAEKPLATVHRFIYNNERICGDMFADANWLPAHRKCKLDCDLGSEICQIGQNNGAESEVSMGQRCLKLPMECQRRLKMLLGTGFGFIELNPAKRPPLNESLTNFAALPPRNPQFASKYAANSSAFVAPFTAANNSAAQHWLENENASPGRAFESKKARDDGNAALLMSSRTEFTRRMMIEIGNGITPVVELPQLYAHIPTLAPPKIPAYLTPFFDAMTTTTTTTALPPPLAPARSASAAAASGGGGEEAGGAGLVPFSTDKSLLPLPDIVLSSSTFPPARPSTTPPANFALPDAEIVRTTVAQPKPLRPQQSNSTTLHTNSLRPQSNAFLRPLSKSSGLLSPQQQQQLNGQQQRTGQFRSQQQQQQLQNPSATSSMVMANKWSVTRPPLPQLTASGQAKRTDERVDDSLQRNYENMLFEKFTTSTASHRIKLPVFSTVWPVQTSPRTTSTTTTAKSMTTTTTMPTPNDYEDTADNFLGGFDSDNIFGITQNPFHVNSVEHVKSSPAQQQILERNFSFPLNLPAFAVDLAPPAPAALPQVAQLSSSSDSSSSSSDMDGIFAAGNNEIFSNSFITELPTTTTTTQPTTTTQSTTTTQPTTTAQPTTTTATASKEMVDTVGMRSEEYGVERALPSAFHKVTDGYGEVNRYGEVNAHAYGGSNPYGNGDDNTVLSASQSREYGSNEIQINSPHVAYRSGDNNNNNGRENNDIDNDTIESDETIHIFGPPMNTRPYEESAVISPPRNSISVEDEGVMNLESNPYAIADDGANIAPPSAPDPTTRPPFQQRPNQGGQKSFTRAPSASSLRRGGEPKNSALVRASIFEKPRSEKFATRKKLGIFPMPKTTVDESSFKSNDSFVVEQQEQQQHHLRHQQHQMPAKQLQQIEFSTERMEDFRNQKPWWIWREMEEKDTLRGDIDSPASASSSVDRSVRCCQWALDGLCDRSWQRVRLLCPKSCGTVVCSSAEGTLSCNRVIDVDVIDCYERRRRLKAFGLLLTSFDAAAAKQLTQQEQRSGELAQTFKIVPNSKMIDCNGGFGRENNGTEDCEVAKSAAAPGTTAGTAVSTAVGTTSAGADVEHLRRAFAIEDEIKRFNSFNKNQKLNNNNSL